MTTTEPTPDEHRTMVVIYRPTDGLVVSVSQPDGQHQQDDIAALRRAADIIDGFHQRDRAEQGRRLASEREDLIARGIDPDELLIPLHPDDGGL